MKLGTLILLLGLAWQAKADGLQSLETFMKSAHSGRAEFVQVVTSPARDGQAARSKTSMGNFEFVRPNRFRFNYKKPFEQTIVADGQTLWLHDVDLNQVTARPQTQALGATPAALIAAAADLRALQADFSLASAPESQGVQWLTATPKSREGALKSIRVGFKNTGRGVELATLEINDNFGQMSVLNFSRFELNPRLPAEIFQFKPPKGADVIRP